MIKPAFQGLVYILHLQPYLQMVLYCLIHEMAAMSLFQKVIYCHLVALPLF